MTIQTFPSSLPGIQFGNIKRPVFDTRVVVGNNGREQRAARRIVPRWEFELSYEFLRDNVNNEFQTLIGFVLNQLGQLNPFYYTDPYDNTATGQVIGTGDGTTTTFRLVRNVLGSSGFIDLVYYCPTLSNVYLNGTMQSSGFSLSASANYGNDSITFASAPSSGVVISADFNFAYVCRLLEDKYDFGQLWPDFYEAKKIDFTTVL